MASQNHLPVGRQSCEVKKEMATIMEYHICVTGIELRFQSLQDSLCVAVKYDRLGMLMDVQAC